MKMKHAHFRPLLGPLFALLLLAGCQTGDKDPGYRCPQAGMMKDADRLAVFEDMANPSRETVTVKGQLFGMTYGCKPAPKKSAMEFHLTLSFSAKKTPLAADLKGLSLPYFVAIIDPEGNLVESRRFKVRLDFQNSNPKYGPDTAVTEEDQNFDVQVPDPITAGKYRVVSGFELIPAQLRYNQGETNLLPPAPAAAPKHKGKN